MIRKLKASGLTLLALFAISAVAATAAQADPVFKASNSSGGLSGNGSASESFTTEAGSVVCEESSFTGTYASAEAATQRMHPTYGKCKAFGFVSATVATGKCDYVFDPYQKVSAGNYKAKVAVDCAEGAITITASTCTAKVEDVPGNQELSYVALENSGGDVKADPETTGITYNVTNDGFLCPFNGTGVKTDGKYTSTGTVAISAEGSTTIEVAGE